MKRTYAPKGILFTVTCCAGFMALIARNAEGQTDLPERQPFEIYALASIMHTVDVTPLATIEPRNSPAPACSGPSGGASGFRTGFAWGDEDIKWVTDIGFHQYSDPHGSSNLITFMIGPRFSTVEDSRLTFYAQPLLGAYRWSVQSPEVNFVHEKLLVSAGAGVDVRLTHHLAFRALELEVLLAGGQDGPHLTS
jgi:hypothetical protein